MSGFRVRVGEILFPSPDWEDFCIPIVSDWIDVVSNSRSDARFKLYFMDGPYYLLCHRKNDNVLISAVDDHTGSIVVHDMIRFNQLKRQLIETAKMLLEKSDKSCDMDSDIKLLENALRRLETGL